MNCYYGCEANRQRVVKKTWSLASSIAFHALNLTQCMAGARRVLKKRGKGTEERNGKRERERRNYDSIISLGGTASFKEGESSEDIGKDKLRELSSEYKMSLGKGALPPCNGSPAPPPQEAALLTFAIDQYFAPSLHSSG